MSEERLLFIYNPNAGRGLVKEHLPAILELLSASGYELIVHATLGQKDAAEVAGKYARESLCSRIICAGGDGTLDEVAGAVLQAGSGIPIGYIPAGSTNDLGYSLGLPGDMLKATETALNGSVFPCDIARFNESFFTYTAAFGAFTEVTYDTPQNIKNVLGHTAYILNCLTKLDTLHTYHARVTYDGKTYEEDYLLGMVASATSVGGIKGVTGEGVELDDGLHELILIKAPGRISKLYGVINDVIMRNLNGKYIRYARVDSVKFEFTDPTPWSLDGEYGGMVSEADISVIKQGIRYIR